MSTNQPPSDSPEPGTDGIDAGEVGSIARRDVNIAGGEVAAGRDITIGSVNLTQRSIAPFNAPPDVREFIDRTGDLERLAEQLTTSSSMVTVGVYGQGGIGKTALATRVLHRLRHHFVDGVLFAQLTAESGRAPDTSSILSDFLYLLNVPADVTSEQRLVSTFRSAVIDKSILVLLDNAVDPRQVAQLLPVSGTSAAIVTGRAPMSTVDGITLHRLDVLPSDDSARLLVRLARLPRELESGEAARSLADMCGRLPLALRVAGAKLQTRSDWTLESFRSRLAVEQRRLDLLRSGDLEVRASLMLSYADRSPQEQRAFRFLSISKAEELPAWILAPLLGIDYPTSELVMERLADAQLVTPSRDDSAGVTLYRIHDLLRLLGDELLQQTDAADEIAAARSRLHHEYLQHVGSAAQALLAKGSRQFGGMDGNSTIDPTSIDPVVLELIDGITVDPMAWFTTNRHGVLDSVEAAVDSGAHDLVSDFQRALQPLLILSPFLEDRGLVHQLALRAGELSGNTAQRAQALVDLGRTERDFGDWMPARTHLAEGVALLRELGDPIVLAKALVIQAVLFAYIGRTDDAESITFECLRIFEKQEDPASIAYSLRTLAAIYRVQSRWAEATEVLERSSSLFASVGDAHRRAITLTKRASVLRHQGRPAEGFTLLNEAISIFTDLNFPLWLYIAQLHRANCLGDVGARGEALALIDDCHQGFSQIGESRWGFIARLHHVRVELANGQAAPTEETIRELENIASTFDDLGDVYSEAVSYWMLCQVLDSVGRNEAARRAGRRAVASFVALGNEPMHTEIENFLNR